jgi:TrpR family transcriptional regulator, trp operon repressor
MTNEDGWRGFLNLCLKVETVKELEELFGLFLTPEEREDLSTRHLIVQELVRGKMTQREMAKNLGVSIAKITRGSNSLKMISKDLRRLLESVS